MDLALFSSTGIEHFFRWGHFLAGVCWIGILWYFNFVQGSYFKEAEAAAKSDATVKLVPRALWWFRWGAMGTFLTGLALLALKAPSWGLTTSWGTLILTGSLMGIFMFLNVWLIIWPAQKIVIASAKAQATGGAADPRAQAKGARAALASRTNTLFSIPLLFFMGAAPHLPVDVDPEKLSVTWPILLLIILGIEANAVFGKKMGPMASVKGVIHSGIALTALLYLVIEITA